MREPISAYAVALGGSQTAQRTSCAEIAGRSPSEMLDQKTLLEARRALLYPNRSIAEISFAVGLDSPAYFSRFFHRKMGVTPREYRHARS